VPWAQVNASDLYYQEAGEGQPLVLLHGMSSCAEAWFQQFEAFAPYFRVIAYDSVNHGHSANSPRDEPEPDRADELAGFLDALNLARPINRRQLHGRADATALGRPASGRRGRASAIWHGHRAVRRLGARGRTA
jgi:pimeloyl-ACP methyl ester carboxylesterase